MGNGYGIFRVEKIKASDAGGLIGRLKHSLREFEYENERSEKNIYGAENWQEAFELYKEKTSGCVKRSNSVGAFEVVVTCTERPEWSVEDYESYLRTANEWVCKKFKKENLFCGCIHYDEKIPHMHLFFAPTETVEKRKKQTRDEKRDGIQRTEKVRQLNAKRFINGKKSLSELQTSFYENVSKNYGFERGELATETHRTHQRIELGEEIKRYKELQKALQKEIELQKAWKETKDIRELRVAEFARNLEHDEVQECWKAFLAKGIEIRRQKAEKASQTHENGLQTSRSGGRKH